MHELQLMKQVVRLVEDVCRDQPSGVPAVIRLHISSHSHLAGHTPHELDATFRMAAHGTQTQGAKLDIITIPAKGRCQICEATFDRTSETLVCPTCGSGRLALQDQPEVIVKEVEWVEESP